jgi:hypothetical protein
MMLMSLFPGSYSSFMQKDMTMDKDMDMVMDTDTEMDTTKGIETDTRHGHGCSSNIRTFVYFPRLWNEFLSPIKSISNKNIFRKELSFISWIN